MSTQQDIPAPLLAMIGDVKGTVSAEHITRVLTVYADMLRAGDVAGIIALYAPNAVLQDPIIAPPRTGDQIREFFQGAVDAMGGIDMRLESAVRVSGNHGAAAYTVHIALEGGLHAYIDTLDVMIFDDAGLIKSQVAYWGPSNIVVVDAERAPHA